VAKGFAHGTCDILELENTTTTSGFHDAAIQNTIDNDQRSYDIVDHRTESGGCWVLTARKAEAEFASNAPVENNISSNFNHFVSQHPGNRDVVRELDCILETRDGFFDFHRHFMIGKSLNAEFHTAVQLLFSHSPYLLADAYQSVLELITFRKTHPRQALQTFDLTKGTKCLQNLMEASSTILQFEDAATVIMLGQILLLYNVLTPWTSTHLIVRNTLLSVKDWYPALAKQPELYTVTVTPVFVDTIECLVRREIPILEFPRVERLPVDRTLGLCFTLLPLLYSLCVRSQGVKMSNASEPAGDCLQVTPYFDIEQQLQAWQPTWPKQFLTTYSALEVTALLTQARVYRLAALLIVHRLWYPLGIEDGVGKCCAASILHELSILKAWKLGEASGFGINFPLLVACMEMPNTAQELMKVVEPLRLDSKRSESILEFVKHVHMKYCHGFKGIWFELVDCDLYRVTLP
jgi:hypothetical protein